MRRDDPRAGDDAQDPIASATVERAVAELSVRGGDALSKAASEGLPSRAEIRDWIERTEQLVLVQRDPSTLRSEVPHIAARLLRLLGDVTLPDDVSARQVVEAFLLRLGAVRALVAEDVEAAFEGDPAARSFAEIVVAYPSIRAVAIQRIAHELHLLRVPILPRMMTEHAHGQSGIDIHPGARIGRRLFIDHGTGVVIGETTLIGDNVRIYQGVTLGALAPGHGASLRGQKRHPTIEDDVTIYAGVTILGGDVVIGRGSVIGGNVWLTESVPPGSKVVAEPPRTLVRQRRARGEGGAPPLHWDI
ncbi:MAG: serine acetyltransferase [Myxococcales bacterium]|nr:serine acetyltransferase [Myxococcales bacterium]MDH5306297.1 serine acetyltransferase [Myxococcales bacterium]